ncbi:prepilin-type N-terminal cleavage/methylation domain-containing protein [Cyanobium sp. PCC 7001]|uniref:prepilin-type N-terminal cleavage/methylation domain-containing protein n=1 Tax=Cyanobium sp. PCC 7001 TaxID=180281 RepID=UPI001CEC258F|nr:prepilin-type N-terminal cleavage/methylation domain-containing protein [Cyanobium sp. PCC 7001]
MLSASVRHRFARRLLPTRPAGHGLTLTELLTVVVVLGVVAAISTSGLLFVLRRERINAAALEVAGWLEEVRNLSARRVDANANAGGCAITLSLSAGMAANAVLATAENACGARDPQLRLPRDLQGTVTGSSTNGNSIIFTPRGLWIANPAVQGPLEIKLLLDGGGPLRCVRLSETLGSIDIGRANTNNVGANCTDYVAL